MRIIYFVIKLYCELHESLFESCINACACVNSAALRGTPVRCSEVNFRLDGTIYSRLSCYNAITTVRRQIELQRANRPLLVDPRRRCVRGKRVAVQQGRCPLVIGRTSAERPSPCILKK